MDSQKVTTLHGFTYFKKYAQADTKPLVSNDLNKPIELLLNSHESILQDIKPKEIEDEPICKPCDPIKPIETLPDPKPLEYMNSSINGFVYKIAVNKSSIIQDNSKRSSCSSIFSNDPSSRLSEISLKRKSTDIYDFPLKNKKSLGLETIYEEESNTGYRKKLTINEFEMLLSNPDKNLKKSLGQINSSDSDKGFQKRNKMISKRLIGCPRLPEIVLKPSNNYQEISNSELVGEILEDYLDQITKICKKIYEGIEVLNTIMNLFSEIRERYYAKNAELIRYTEYQNNTYEENIQLLNYWWEKITKILKSSPKSLIEHSQSSKIKLMKSK